MGKEMDWDNFVPTQEIRNYERKCRESEYIKAEIAAERSQE